MYGSQISGDMAAAVACYRLTIPDEQVGGSRGFHVVPMALPPGGWTDDEALQAIRDALNADPRFQMEGATVSVVKVTDLEGNL